MQSLIILVISGFFAGMLGGLLGIGGGIVLMPILRFFVGLSPAFASGTCVITVFFTTLGGAFRHYKLGHVNLRPILPVIAAGAVSTIVFSVFFPYLVRKPSWLDFGTGLLFSIISLRMIIEGLTDRRGRKSEEGLETVTRSSVLTKMGIGALAGALPGLLGIGTGAVLVPAFTLVLGIPIKIAIGSSLTCFCVNAFLSSGFKLFQGYAVIQVALPLCLGALIGSNIGAVLNRRFPSPLLKITFGITFLYISFKYISLFLGAKL
jgi:uncharacterized membrane protein YfcA